MSANGIDMKKGIVDVYVTCPKEGDSIMIVNCGDHFEIRAHSWVEQPVPPIELTVQDIERLKQGDITWN